MTQSGKFAKGLSVLLAALLIFMTLPGGLTTAKAAEGDKTTLSINGGSIVIGDGAASQNGNSITYNANGYIIAGSGTTANTVSVTGGKQDITFEGVSINAGSNGGICAFYIASGASASLTLSGENTLKSGSGRAGLEVPEGASVSIAGTGSLTASGGNGDMMSDDGSGAGIGGAYNAGCGNVCIIGGAITATGGSGDSAGMSGGAGIGGGYGGSGGTVTIAGGTVKAAGGRDEIFGGGAGIGSGNGGLGSGTGVSGGTVTIAGGTVTASGSCGGAGIGGGANVSGGKVIITGGTVTANASADDGSGTGVGSAGIGGGECGSGGSTIISGGTVTANGDNALSAGAGIGKGYFGACNGSTVISGGSVKTTSVSGNVADGSGNTEYCVTVTGLTAAADVSASVSGGRTFSCRTDSDGKLYLWMSDGDNKPTICCGGTYYGADATVSDADTGTAAGAMTVLDISQGDIAITDGGVTGKNSEGGNALANEYGYVISGTTKDHTISITGGTHSIVLKNTDIDVSGCAFSVSPNVSVYLTLSGKSVLSSGDFYAGLSLPDGASITVAGVDTDSLEATGGFTGAGIGGGKNCKCGDLTINGGSVSAAGGSGAAGIGGGWQASIDKIVITGGTVTAKGGYRAAGIGGGTLFGGGTILISGGIVTSTGIGGAGIGGGALLNGSDIFGGGSSISIIGGTIKARSDTADNIGCGDGIGNGYYDESMGSPSGNSIIISGGSVDVSSISGTPTNDGSTPVYPTTVTLPSGTNVSAISVMRNNSAVLYGFDDMQTDVGKTLYLYLPASATGNDTKVDVTANGTACDGYHGTVKTAGTQANPNVLKMDQSAFGFQHTNTQSFTYGDAISLDTAVAGGTLKGTVAYAYSGTDMFGNTYSDDTTCPANAGDGDYTITATLPGNACYYDAAATKNFVINRKNIGASGVTVSVEPATYTGTALSPDVNATFGSNTLAGGTDFEVCDGSGGAVNPTYTSAGNYGLLIKGIGNYTGSVAKTYTVAQKAVALTLTASQSEAKAGGDVTLTAAVFDAVDLPAGTVTFRYGGTAIQSGVSIGKNGEKYAAQTTWSNVPAGEYTLSAEYVPAASDNYACSAEAEIGGYNITKYDQTGFGFSDDGITKTYGDGAFTVTASGGQGSGAVTYKSGDDSVATVTDTGTVTIKKAGAVTITAKKASDSTHNETSDTITINIGKAASAIKTAPTASGGIIALGRLSSVALTGGESSVAGFFAWTDPDALVSKDGAYEVTFTPADSTDYSACTCTVSVKVTPVVTNSATGVQYDLSDADLPGGVTSVSVSSFILQDTGDGNSNYSVVGKLIDGGTSAASASAIKIYSMSLLDQNNRAVTGFTGKITVRIPIPAGMGGDLRVYWYNDQNGTVTDMNAEQRDGYMVFETTHFSYYAVTELSAKSSMDSGAVANPDTGGSYPFLPAVLFGGTLCGLAVVRKTKKYGRKN